MLKLLSNQIYVVCISYIQRLHKISKDRGYWKQNLDSVKKTFIVIVYKIRRFCRYILTTQ